MLTRLAIFALFGISACCTGQASADPAAKPSARVGTYDSRAIAIAFSGSKFFSAEQAPIVEEYNDAKARGDQQRVSEIETSMKEQQAKMHRQGFGTASVDDLLAHVQDRIAAIEDEHSVVAVVSKWDESTLSKYSDHERIDLTGALVALYDPGAEQLGWIKDLEGKDPIAHDELRDDNR